MLKSEAIDTRMIVYQGRTITVKDLWRELRWSEKKIQISEEAIAFCSKQDNPANDWGVAYALFGIWRRAGLTNREIFQLVLRIPGWNHVHFHFTRLHELCMTLLDDTELAYEFCNDAINHPEVYYSFAPYYSATEGLVILAKHNKLREEFCSLLDWRMSNHDIRTVLTALPADVQHKVLLTLCTRERFANNQGIVNPRYALFKMHVVIDLLPAELDALISELIAELTSNKGNKPEEIANAEALIQNITSKQPWQQPLTAEGITQSAAYTVRYLREQQQVRARFAAFDRYVESLRDRHITIQAKELLSVAAWKKASPERKTAIVKTIEKALAGLTFTQFSDNELGIAVFKHKASKQVLSLVPGGEVDMGLSEAEEQLLRNHLASGSKKLSAEDSEILNGIDYMRPTKKISIEPMLVAQKLSVRGDVSALLDWLEANPFRLPSEAEWEYLARGTRKNELTWNGHVIPDKTWMKDIKKHVNDFQLGEFGLHAEICSDVWKPTHTAVDNQPVTGDGARVCRGGAADLAPWQNTGEWHLLCTAHRYSSESMFLLAGRGVMGIRIEKVS